MERPDAAAHCQRHEDLVRRPGDDVQESLAVFVGRRDVQKAEFVGAILIIDLGDLDRIAGVAQVHEGHAFDDTAILDVQTGNDAFGQHDRRRFRFRLSLPLTSA